mmetsp:Transcript_26793/g.61681  ORF Transcript_26793/g.61681 Transcript_26793/m.61681 type:complete len:95 (-) Transcript_26793:285-569(-)
MLCFLSVSEQSFEISEVHTFWGEAFGFVMWFWIFYRFKEDGKVLLGICHPWENHPHDDHHDHEDAHEAFDVHEDDQTPINRKDSTRIKPDTFDV